MAGDTVCGDSNVAFLLQNDKFPCDPLWIPISSAALRGSKLMGDYENASGGTNNMDRSPLQMLIKEENVDFDACLNQPGKKRRLTASQVQFLERNFAAENKLEPERKLQLAKELGLQPRQIAIWFQNRRARFKNKQLETDHDFLKSSYEKLRADYDKLFKEKESLKNEVHALKEKLLVRQKSIEDLEPQNVTHSPCPELQVPFASAITQMVPNLVRVTAKQEDASSTKSDAFDSDSSHSFLVPADSSNVFELHQSDFSQDILGRSFLLPPFLTKLYHHPAATSSNFEFSVEDQPFWSWAY